MTDTRQPGPVLAQARARSQALAQQPPVAADAGRGGALPRPLRPKGGIDLATVLGLVGGFGLVGAALALGGSLGAFFNLPSVAIVLGGTVAVTAVSFSMRDVASAGRLLLGAVTRTVHDPQAVARYVLQLADIARRNGPLALQPLAPSLAAEPVLQRSIEMIVDGLPADDVERILRTEIEADQARARAGAAVLRRAAEVAPAMGLIGTLVGLVQMLDNLQDPASIGPAMAVALLTTFYGAVLGSMVLSPLAGKVERNAEVQALVSSLYMLGAGSVARQENPRRLEILINTVLPPELRLSTFD
ncbi:motility protein A [Rhodocista pekingensis]|uniref:Motility protein A n=1 Tax=Rhodocista pekingensis TaxID=201185 RepID=A0ABW2KP09_9PROT